MQHPTSSHDQPLSHDRISLVLQVVQLENTLSCRLTCQASQHRLLVMQLGLVTFRQLRPTTLMWRIRSRCVPQHLEEQGTQCNCFDLLNIAQGNSTFKQLCHSQSQLMCTVLRQTGGQPPSSCHASMSTLCCTPLGAPFVRTLSGSRNDSWAFAGSCGTRVTVYRREPATFEAGQLQLSKVTSYTDLG